MKTEYSMSSVLPGHCLASLDGMTSGNRIAYPETPWSGNNHMGSFGESPGLLLHVQAANHDSILHEQPQSGMSGGGAAFCFWIGLAHLMLISHNVCCSFFSMPSDDQAGLP